MALPTLPPEICLEIFSWVLLDGTPASLYPFLRVCRYYQAQAQHLLYHNVDLSGCDLQKVRSWCLGVTRHQHLAHRVRFLSLSLPVTLEARDNGKIGHALNRCVNLKDLWIEPRIEHAHQSSLAYINHSNEWRLLDKRAFRLRKFTDTYFNMSCSPPFWRDQQDIRLLSIVQSSTFPLNYDVEPLPRLESLAARPQALPHRTRNLQYLQLHLHDNSRDLEHMTRIRVHQSTLQTLSVVRIGAKVISTFDIITQAAHFLPDLTNLYITDSRDTMKNDREEPPIIPVLEQFTALQSLVLQVCCPNVMRFHRDLAVFEESHESNKTMLALDMSRPDDRFAFALELMDHFRSLQRIEIGFQRRLEPATAGTCILTRGKEPGMEISSAMYDTLKWDATEDFYSSVD
ncbi:hypothetical protein R3P38DRAFT_2910384 [Favolaschia claudopus]|uniref:F-box domain-containing protein n=1 Tax=Favolaschia claudopus TaxID=2862362 RepID=A0AAW0CCZ9_9AGAR